MSDSEDPETARRRRVAREVRLRRQCRHHGLTLRRVRRYTDLAPDRGLYQVLRGDSPVFESFDLGAIEEYLLGLVRAARRERGAVD